MPKFQIKTTSGDTYTDGDREKFEFLGVNATLESYEHDGDYVVLNYSDGIAKSIPEAQIAHIVEA